MCGCELKNYSVGYYKNNVSKPMRWIRKKNIVEFMEKIE